VREIAPPEGYTLNDTVLLVEIMEDGEVLELVIENTLIRGGVRGYKVDSETNTGLPGALIGLFHGDETEFTPTTAIATTTSDANGHWSFGGLPFGAYIVRELEAPEGYILSDELFRFTITEDGADVVLIIENDPEPEPEPDPEPKPTPTPQPSPTPTPPSKAPQTGDETSLPWLPLILSALGIVAVGVIWVMYEKKKKR